MLEARGVTVEAAAIASAAAANWSPSGSPEHYHDESGRGRGGAGDQGVGGGPRPTGRVDLMNARSCCTPLLSTLSRTSTQRYDIEDSKNVFSSPWCSWNHSMHGQLK